MAEQITLGERTFEVRPLKLGKLRGLLDRLAEMQGKANGEAIDATIAVLAAGLPDAGVTVDDLLELDASLDELNVAVGTVIRVAGRLKAVEPGEAKPQPAG